VVDARTYQTLIGLGIPPETVPLGSVRFLGWEELRGLGEKSHDCKQWILSTNNREAIAYSVDHEHKPCVGIVLRNLHSGAKKDHKAITPDLKPLWHNFYYALPQVYKLGVCVLCEGPKDARVLASADIPAIAVLGVVPSQEHLRVIRRYAGTVLWIGDRDPVDDGRAELRANRAKYQARELELGFFDFRIPVKDPALLAGNQEWLGRIRDRVLELSSFSR
jgi:hypothetical protein